MYSGKYMRTERKQVQVLLLIKEIHLARSRILHPERSLRNDNGSVALKSRSLALQHHGPFNVEQYVHS